MAIIVETGFEVAGANSYVAVVDADIYFANIGNTAWAAADPALIKTPYLIRAQIYMAQAFRSRWKGWRHTSTQVLDWPRYNVDRPDVGGNYGSYPYYYLPTDIPQQIKDAQCVLAGKILANNGADLAPDIDPQVIMEQVGSLKVEYSKLASPITIFRDVELLLAPFFTSSGINANVGRA